MDFKHCLCEAAVLALHTKGAGLEDRALYLMARAAHDGGEHSPGSVIPGKASLHQAGAVVAYKRGGLILITHGVGFLGKARKSNHCKS